MGKLINDKRTVKFILIGLIVAIAAFAAVLLIAGTAGQNREVSAQTDEETVSTGDMEIDASAERAQELYGCRVEDVNDTAAVVRLLETIGLENIAGKYTSTITTEDDTEVLSIVLEDVVQQSGKETLDQNMEKCSQQIIALMPSVGKVQWSYSLDSAEEEDGMCVLSLDEEGAAKQLGADVNSYGKSANAFLGLLMKQAEEN